MSITDELREWVDEYGCEYGTEKFIAGSFGSIGQDKLLAIADRIDVQHRKALERVAAMVDEPSQDAFDVLMDGFNIGRARGYDEGFKAHLADLEARVDRIERKLEAR